MDEKYLSPAIIRAGRIFEFLVEQGGAGFGEILAEVGIPRSSLSHILNTLQHLEYVRQVNGKYVASSKVLQIANLILAKMDIRGIAMPIMRDLVRKVDFSCNLGVISGREAIYVAKVESKNAYMSMAWVGKRIPLMTSSLGKALLAQLPENEVLSLLEDNPTFQTAASAVPSVPEFLRELAVVREQGWASEENAVTDGISCYGVPVKRSGEFCAALSVSGNTDLLRRAGREAILREATSAAARISDALAHP